MMRILAFGAESAAALAKSLTIEALVLNKSVVPSAEGHLGGLYLDSLTITSHSWLSRYASGDQDDLRSSQSFLEPRRSRIVALDGTLGVDMTYVGRNTYTTLSQGAQLPVRYGESNLDHLEYRIRRAQ